MLDTGELVAVVVSAIIIAGGMAVCLFLTIKSIKQIIDCNCKVGSHFLYLI